MRTQLGKHSFLPPSRDRILWRLFGKTNYILWKYTGVLFAVQNVQRPLA